MKKKIIMILTLSMLVSQVSFSMASAQAVPNKATTSTQNSKNKAVIPTISSIKSINLSANSSVKLTDINILTQDTDNILTYTLTYTNNDKRDISLIDYWSKVKTKSGTSFTSNILTRDKEKKKVSAQSSLSVTYYAKIGKISKVSDLVLELVKWDFNMPNYEKKLGQYVVPANVVAETQPNGSKTVQVNDIPIKTKIASSNIYSTKDYSYVSVGLNFTNVGYKLLEDPKYKYVIKTADGYNYPVEVDASSVDYKIQPQDNKTLNLMTRIPSSIKTDKLQLQIIQDDETSKLSLPVATYQIAQIKKENIEKDQDGIRTISVGSNKVDIQLKSSWLSTGKDKNEVTTTLKFTNSGNQAVTLPKYEFSFMTKEGYMYPVKTKALENLTIDPLGEKSVNLSAEIPVMLNTTNMQLSINQPKDPAQKTSDINYPIAIFKLPELTAQENILGKEYTVETNKATLGVRLNSVQRLPWVDGDIISAKVIIKNYRFDSVEIPKLDGSLKFDNISATDGTKLVQTNNSLILGANQTVEAYIVTKIPYDMDFRQLQVKLMEKISDDTSNDLIQMSGIGSMSKLPIVKNGESYELTTQGRKADLKVRKTSLYPGSSSNIIYSEIEMKSLESRQVDLSQLTGYFKSKDGQYFKANAIQVDHSTGPNGKNLVTLWAKIPRNLDSSNMQLVLGESITDNKFTTPKAEATAYINAAAYDLVQSSNEYKSSLSNVDLFPYALSITSVNGYTTGSSISLNLNYNLERNNEYEMGNYEHKLVVEVVDSSGRISEREVALESELKLGNGKSTTLSFDGSADTNRKNNNYFTIVLYDQFQGQKIKLASQSYYFTNNDIGNKD